MSFVYIVIAGINTLLAGASTRLDDLRSEDRGSVSVEQVIITGAVLLVAVAIAAAITLAVNGRLGAIV